MHAKNYLIIKETISHQDPPFQDKIILNANSQITHLIHNKHFTPSTHFKAKCKNNDPSQGASESPKRYLKRWRQSFPKILYF
jgi:hypothetical protein